ncbi:MAG TPA: alpha/beta fold hydrolase [Microvirga sp.]|nr:alpha/beta fold hydrolase [Microvirga sp.]
MRAEAFDFMGEDGRLLAGRIQMPDGAARDYAIFAHCFTCASDSLAAVRVSRALAEQGIGVLRFDFTGLGRSEGEFGRHGLSGDVSDIICAARAMGEAGRTVRLLVGHSLGGAAVLAAAGRISEVRAVATIAAPFEADHVLLQFGEALGRIDERGESEVQLGGRPFSIRRSFVEDLRSHAEEEYIASLRRPLLVLHSPVDTVVGIANAEGIFRSAKHPKSFVSLDKADHLLTRNREASYVANVIASWASLYLDQDPDQAG